MFRTAMVKPPGLSFKKKPQRIPVSLRTPIVNKTKLIKPACLMKNSDFGSKFLKRLRKVKTMEVCYENCKTVTG